MKLARWGACSEGAQQAVAARAAWPSLRRWRPASHLWFYLLGALAVHVLMLGGLLYAGYLVRLPPPSLPMVVAELLSPPVPVTTPPSAAVLLPVSDSVMAGDGAAADIAERRVAVAASSGQPAVSPPVGKTTLVSAGLETDAADGAPVALPVSAPPSPIPQAPIAPADALISGDADQHLADDERVVWEAQMRAHLQRLRRYPSRAQALAQEDQVLVQVRIDRNGRVLSQRIVGSRGYALLDDEALALMMRADPLPTPPAELDEQQLEFRVPVDFFIGRRVRQMW